MTSNKVKTIGQWIGCIAGGLTVIWLGVQIAEKFGAPKDHLPYIALIVLLLLIIGAQYVFSKLKNETNKKKRKN